MGRPRVEDIDKLSGAYSLRLTREDAEKVEDVRMKLSLRKPWLHPVSTAGTLRYLIGLGIVSDDAIGWDDP